MWILFSRHTQPDAVYWKGRRCLAVLDALVWPLAWAVLIARLPGRTGLVGAVSIALLLLSAFRRTYRAVWHNHRYSFSTVRWGLVLWWLLVTGVILRCCLLPGHR